MHHLFHVLYRDGSEKWIAFEIASDAAKTNSLLKQEIERFEKRRKKYLEDKPTIWYVGRLTFLK